MQPGETWRYTGLPAGEGFARCLLPGAGVNHCALNLVQWLWMKMTGRVLCFNRSVLLQHWTRRWLGGYLMGNAVERTGRTMCSFIKEMELETEFCILLTLKNKVPPINEYVINQNKCLVCCLFNVKGVGVERT